MKMQLLGAAGVGACNGTNSLQRLAEGRPVPQEYAQQDWLLLQASMKSECHNSDTQH